MDARNLSMSTDDSAILCVIPLLIFNPHITLIENCTLSRGAVLRSGGVPYICSLASASGYDRMSL